MALLVLSDKTTGVHCRDKFPDLFFFVFRFFFVFCLFFFIKYFSRLFYFHEILGASHLGSPRRQ